MKHLDRNPKNAVVQTQTARPHPKGSLQKP